MYLTAKRVFRRSVCSCATTLAVLMSTAVLNQAKVAGQGPTETMLLLSQHIASPDEVIASVTNHLNTSQPGSRVHVIHGGHSVASFWVPSGTSRTRFRSRHVKPALAKIVRLLSSPTPEGSDQIDLPGLVTAIKGRRETKLPLRVSIYASPLYLDPNKQAYSHEGKYVTADGAIDVEPSPFRTDLKLPEETLVTWITPNALFGYDAVHRDAVIRFNSLYIQEISGTLVRTSDKLELLFNHRMTEPVARVARSTDDGTTRVQRSEDSRIENDNPTSPFLLDQKRMIVAGRENADPANKREAMVAEAMTNPNRVMVVITWQSEDPNCDLDLWLTSSGLEGELNHANPKLPWGELTRDVQHTEHASGVADIQKHEGVLVKHGRVQDLTLWINVYQTRSPATVTITRIWNQDRRSRTVVVKSETGDGARYQRFRSGSTAWKRINLFRFSAADVPGSL